MRYLFTLAAVFAMYTVAWCQSQTDFKAEAKLLQNVVAQHHFAPPLVDNAFSAAVFDAFVNDLDADRTLFTQTDIAALAIYRDKIDLDLTTNSWVTLPAFTHLYKSCLDRAIALAEQQSQTPFEYKTREILVHDTLWAKDEAALRERWRTKMKYETLRRLAELKSKNAALRDDDFLKQYESEARLQIRAHNTNRIKRILAHPGGFENYVGVAFLHTVAGTFDAHTQYFSLKQWESFLSSLSTEGLYFGFSLKANDANEIEIDKLMPGGPAWRSGVIYAGDVVERLKWEGREWLDIYGMDIDEVESVLDESNTLALSLEFRSKSGERKTVVLRKEKISSEENVVRSVVLEGSKKIGYIFLPGFYTNWGDGGGSRCANDVAKEIVKLKKQNIEGLILDVRYNGGGSLEEAVAMAGIFIDAGPIGVTKDKAGMLVSAKDMNRGTIYDGPLVLMVNALSASASEFLVASLQDYRRAIVVGGRTYGKATAQHLFSLDPKAIAQGVAKTKGSMGFATVTTQKIYRVTGKTAQHKGVMPDIILPDVFDSLHYREEFLQHTLPSDSVQKKTYYQPLPLLPLVELKAKSASRVAAGQAFGVTSRYSGWLAQTKAYGRTVPLAWTEYMTLREKRFKEFQDMQRVLEQPSNVFTARSTDATTATSPNEFAQTIQAQWMKKLQHDISLDEAFNILCDYITKP